MYSKIQLAGKYFHYNLAASSGKGHGIHSPFVFEMISKVLNDRQPYSAYNKIESLRSQLLKDQTVLEIRDFGAGSAVLKTNKRTVASITKHSSKSRKYGQLLYRMVKFYQPGNIVELGTSLGITTSYLAAANTDAKVITIEGVAPIAVKAKENFEVLGIRNVELTQGNFDDTLPSVIRHLSRVDFAFIDGNHRQESTERYFHQLLAKVGNDSILVFDDIHWSKEMEAAWKSICNDAAVRCSIDLFFLGIILFRDEFKQKQHFIIRF